ncbi:MAG TPA: TonB-dependent receptor [Bryobacteraceae bacterium]|nr:TonB-dependent receptor [Bryobacteraceae bacterium]
MFCLGPAAHAGGTLALAGSILGEVKSVAGVTEMGARVLLYDRHDQLVRHVLTDEQGRFGFVALAPDIYSIRVTLASFVPAIRRNISVAAGTDSLLQINLSGVFSTIDILSSASHGTLMGDDWKWVLRASPSTRPILRFLPGSKSAEESSSRPFSDMFSQTEGMVKVSAGDSDAFGGAGSQQDLGTAFALATSIYGKSRLQLSGNLGYATNGGMPAAGFRTTYSRASDSGSSPEITLSMQQMYLPGRGDAVPVLRTASLGMYDHVELTDRLKLEYGFNYESVTFLSHLNYMSPFARATYDLGAHNSLRVAFSSGTQPGQLLARNVESGDTLSQDLAALAMAPRVSLNDAHAQVERRESFEASYQRVAGSRTYSAGAYHEAVSNAAFLMSGPSDFLPASELLTQLGSSSQVFDAGSYQRTGYSASMAQALGEHSDVKLAVGRSGALLAGAGSALDAAALRGEIRTVQRSWLTARASHTIAVTGTRVTTSYGYTDFRTLMPSHLSMTDQTSQETGWNVYIRQPLPALPGMFGAFGRFEASAELRNLLAQGYLPVVVNDQRAVLTNAPRAVRGGLSFIF